MEWQHTEDMLARVPHIEELQAARQTSGQPAWLVGGCVRDLLLGRVPMDVDIAAQNPEPFAQAFADIMHGHVVPMDPERGVWRVAIASNAYLDFCRFRDEHITGDLLGRDFTINAIAFRLPDEESDGGLFDPLRGVDDLNQHVLRMVSARAFSDDPARILRAFRFAAELGLEFEDNTWDALQASAKLLNRIAPERILAEWWKICAAPRSAATIQRMDEASVLTVLFPELRATKGVTQNAYHHLDVWEHMLLAMSNMEWFLSHPEDVFQDLLPYFAPLLDDPHRRARLIFLALIHDIGKPPTRSVKAGKVHFYGHETAGADIAAAICRRLRMSSDDTRAITAIIRHHMRPLHLLQSAKHHDLSRRSMLKFFDDAGAHWMDIMALSLADKSSGRGPAAAPDVQAQLRDLFRTLITFYQEQYLPAIGEPLLNGHDLVDQLHVPAGPAIGELLKHARNLQIQGKLATHDDAMQWARKHHR